MTDTAGRHYQPGLPLDACGGVLDATAAVIDALPWQVTGTDTVRETPVFSPPDKEGCFTVYDTPIVGDLPSMDITPQPGPAPSLSLDSEVTSLLVCRYALDTDPMNAIQVRGHTTVRFGRFVSRSTLDGQAARDFWTMMAAAPAVTGTCAIQAPFAVIWSGGGASSEIVVELGGCYRTYIIGQVGLHQLSAGGVSRLLG